MRRDVVELPQGTIGVNTVDAEAMLAVNRELVGPGALAHAPADGIGTVLEVDGAGPGSRIVHALPSIASVMVSAWFDSALSAAARKVSSPPLEEWLAQVLAADADGASAQWRYDRAVAASVSRVGASRVHVVTGSDDRLLSLLSSWWDLPEELVAAEAGSVVRPLSDVPLLSHLVAEACAPDFPAHHGVRLLRAAAEQLGRRRPVPVAGAAAMGGTLVDALTEHTRAMSAAISRLGVELHGDVEDLVWPQPVAAPSGDAVPVATAADLALGALRSAGSGATDHDDGSSRVTGERGAAELRRLRGKVERLSGARDMVELTSGSELLSRARRRLSGRRLLGAGRAPRERS